MAQVTGIGGVFLRARDPKVLTAWYAEHLGFSIAPGGYVNFEWTDTDGSTAWTAFKQDTEYLGEQTQQAMVNYRVDDLDGVLERLRAAGATIDPKRDDSFGRFAWAVDPEGNRFKLWEPPPA